MMKEVRERLDADFEKLHSSDEYRDWDPYAGLDLTRGDGKVEVDFEDYLQPEVKTKVSKKYRYFVMKRPRPLEEVKRFFQEFDWKAKGVVRKRF